MLNTLEGIVNLNLTLGERELKAFELSQAQLKNAHLPFFVKVINYYKPIFDLI